MRILLVSQWYKPINAAAAKRTSKMAEFLVKQKHDVLVLTGMPNYPTGVLDKKYRFKLYHNEKIDGVNILRTYELPAPNKGVVKRLINNFSFLISSMVAVFILDKFDIVIVSSPPFLGGITGLFVNLIHKSKFIFDVRDLWPDSAIELGFVKKNWMKKCLIILEGLYYRKADKILTVTPNIKNHLVIEGIPENKIVTLLNSVDTNIFKPKIINRKMYGFSENDFIICFVGNHTENYDLKTVLNTANLLKNNVNLKFLFIGEGEDKDNLIKFNTELKLDNTFFINEQPSQIIADYINISDIGLISLAKFNVTQNSIPTKASEYLSCGKPVIASISGDMKKLLTSTQSGIIYPSGNHKILAETIIKLYKNPDLKIKMGQNARKLAIDIFSNKNFANILENTFN